MREDVLGLLRELQAQVDLLAVATARIAEVVERGAGLDRELREELALGDESPLKIPAQGSSDRNIPLRELPPPERARRDLLTREPVSELDSIERKVAA